MTGPAILYLAIGAALAWDARRSVKRCEPDLALYADRTAFAAVTVFWLPLAIGAVVLFFAEKRR